MGALIEGLNVAYDVKETRVWWRRTLLAILLTIALTALIITRAGVDVLRRAHSASDREPLRFRPDLYRRVDGVAMAARARLRLLAFELIYYCAPDLHEKQPRWLAPGAVIGVSLWLLVSFVWLVSYLL